MVSGPLLTALVALGCGSSSGLILNVFPISWSSETTPARAGIFSSVALLRCALSGNATMQTPPNAMTARAIREDISRSPLWRGDPRVWSALGNNPARDAPPAATVLWLICVIVAAFVDDKRATADILQLQARRSDGLVDALGIGFEDGQVAFVARTRWTLVGFLGLRVVVGACGS